MPFKASNSFILSEVERARVWAAYFCQKSEKWVEQSYRPHTVNQMQIGNARNHANNILRNSITQGKAHYMIIFLRIDNSPQVSETVVEVRNFFGGCWSL